MQEQTEQKASRWTPELILQALKEVVTAALGLVIVIFTLVMTYKVFAYVGQNTQISQAKDVLMLVLGLAGVVLGYYFGRVPADARAAQAQGQAEAAHADVQTFSAAAQANADELDKTITGIQPSAAARGAGEAAVSDEVVDNLKHVRDKLRQMSTMYSRR